MRTTLRIDSHQHFWRYRSEDYPWIGVGMDLLAQDRMPYQYQPLLADHGLHASIAVQARSGRDETAFLLELARHDRHIAGVIGWEDIASPDLPQHVAEWGSEKLLGFRHQVQDEGDAASFLAQPEFNGGIAWLQKNGYVYDVLVCERQLSDVQSFCSRHDSHWLVLDHLGKPALREFRKNKAAYTRWRQEIMQLGQLQHVACKISGLVTEADWMRGLSLRDYDHIVLCLDTALDAFGPQRLMFGSDWPVCLLAASYARVATVVREWATTRLSIQEQEALWGGTAARCYGITG